MYLKSLELHGFKSFPDKTVLKFNPGTTIIVGPNGSGKSNITDAMRWVLGELSSKSLRGSKMEDVIFSGADGVRPMGFAEVSITFDNSGEEKTLPSDYDEITVTRRYYRAGDSAYFINRKPVRLKDIYELFMNTGVGREGYSIIGQGRIAEIISKKSEERRNIFEEAAGITKYRYRKNESQKKLTETENNMVRVGDIASELESRIGPLERDAAKARRYLELYDEKKKLDVSLWKFDMDKLRANLDKFEAETKMSAHELEMAEDTLRQLEDTIERMYAASSKNKEESQRLYDEISGVKSAKSKLENDVRLIENNTLHAQNRLESEKRAAETAGTALEGVKARREALTESLKGIAESITLCDGQLLKLTEERNKTIAERNSKDAEIDSLFADRQKADAQLGDLRVRLNVLKNSISEGSRRKEGIDEEINGYKKELEKLERDISEESETVATYDAGAEAEKKRFAEIESRLSDAQAEEGRVRAELSKVMAESEALGSRIAAMERMLEHFDGYNNSIKFVMNEAAAGKLSGIRGPLSHLIKVDSKYAVALETAMGGALQNIVTADEASAKAAIASLKRSGAGRATFYPITTVTAQPRNAELQSAASCRGFVGFADELVDCESDYREIVRSIVGRVCVFDNIDNASDMARARGWRVRAVTLDGQQINAGGSFTGGSARRDSGMLTRGAQIDSMKAEKSERDAAADRLKGSLSEIEKKLSSLTRTRADADEKRRLMESLASVEKTTLGELEAKRDMTRGLIEKLEGDVARFDENKQRSAEDIKLLEGLINDGQAALDELICRREAVAAERGELDAFADELAVRISDIQIKLAGLKKDRENTELSVSEAESRAGELAEEIKSHIEECARLADEIGTAAERKDGLAAMGEQTDSKLCALEEKLKNVEAEGDRIEESLSETRRREKEQSAKKEIIFINHTKNTNKLDGLRDELDKMTSRLWDEYELTYTGAMELLGEDGYEEIAEGTRTRSHQRLVELKSQIRSLGHVNVAAIDEFAETKERYDYIKRQMDDLEASKRELEGIIAGIESDMKRMFTEAFETINRNFGEVFRELFGGGVAELSLTDPDNVLTSGIEISAAPPGKTIKNLSLLSGGEQAFIAIALMFALIKYSPSPFCIFDEIEAALDEVNVTRVANYVHKFSSEMQIIMITHRRGTMDIADTLYGVTMPRRGISKVFTLDVNAADGNDSFLKN